MTAFDFIGSIVDGWDCLRAEIARAVGDDGAGPVLSDAADAALARWAEVLAARQACLDALTQTLPGRLADLVGAWDQDPPDTIPSEIGRWDIEPPAPVPHESTDSGDDEHRRECASDTGTDTTDVNDNGTGPGAGISYEDWLNLPPDARDALGDLLGYTGTTTDQSIPPPIQVTARSGDDTTSAISPDAGHDIADDTEAQFVTGLLCNPIWEAVAAAVASNLAVALGRGAVVPPASACAVAADCTLAWMADADTLDFTAWSRLHGAGS